MRFDQELHWSLGFLTAKMEFDQGQLNIIQPEKGDINYHLVI